MTDRRGFLTSSLFAIAGAGLAAWLGNPSIGAVDAKTDDKGTLTVIEFDDTGRKRSVHRKSQKCTKRMLSGSSN
jgi:hypothetical protein